MKRLIYNELVEWKTSVGRKPLLIQGARQVGKTYLISMFGRKEYANFIYLNFEQDSNIGDIFRSSLDPGQIILNTGLYLGRKIDAEDTLIFFDEIQAVPEVLTSLKYFKEKAPQYHIIAAGSLLGVSVGKQKSFPVGMVNFMTMYPMTFQEFLIASGDEQLSSVLRDERILASLNEVIHNKLTEKLKIYLFLGGMPEVVDNFLRNEDISEVRKIQMEILKGYSRDLSKYTTKSQALNTEAVWSSIPVQLARENRKFKYTDVKKGGRATLLADSLNWLNGAGLIYKALLVETPKLPLAGYADKGFFKVYMFDTGLLGAILGLSSDLIIRPADLFREYYGLFIENFVATEMAAMGLEHYFWKSKYEAEVDFLLSKGNKIWPLEVKSGTSRNLKSLRSYEQRFHPDRILRISPRPYSVSEEFTNLPLYAVQALACAGFCLNSDLADLTD